MADFILPVSGTSTHKSVNPHSLVFTNAANGTVTYDGSIATTIDIGSLTVGNAKGLVQSSIFTTDLGGNSDPTEYSGRQQQVNVAISGILGTTHGGTGLSSLGAAGTVLGIAANGSNKSLGYQSITLTTTNTNNARGQAIGIKVGTTAVSTIELEAATDTKFGVVSTAEQSFSGTKSFLDGVHSPLFCVEDSSNAHKVQLEYNSTTKALDFNFV